MLREIADEEPLINIDSDEKGSDIKISIMGEVQLEILERQLLERFNVKVSFDSGKVLFKEDISLLDIILSKRNLLSILKSFEFILLLFIVLFMSDIVLSAI